MLELSEAAIYMIMLLRPDTAHITPDGTRIYLLDADDELWYIEGEGFLDMDEQEISQVIQANLIK